MNDALIVTGIGTALIVIAAMLLFAQKKFGVTSDESAVGCGLLIASVIMGIGGVKLLWNGVNALELVIK